MNHVEKETAENFYGTGERDHQLILRYDEISGYGVSAGGYCPHKRWSMWFNSKQREEPYQVLTSS